MKNVKENDREREREKEDVNIGSTGVPKLNNPYNPRAHAECFREPTTTFSQKT